MMLLLMMMTMIGVCGAAVGRWGGLWQDGGSDAGGPRAVKATTTTHVESPTPTNKQVQVARSQEEWTTRTHPSGVLRW